MKNIRINPKRQFVDNFGTGDHQSFFVYEVVRDFEDKELNPKIPYAKSVIDKGVVIETFNSESNAKLFMQALETKIAVVKAPLLNMVIDGFDYHFSSKEIKTLSKKEILEKIEWFKNWAKQINK